jgi:hypothetical protein
MSPTDRLTSTRHLASSRPRPNISRRAIGAGLLLLACLCEARAQESSPAVSQDLALLVSLSDGRAVTLSYDVASERARTPSSAVPLAVLDRHAVSEAFGLGDRLWASRGRGAPGDAHVTAKVSVEWKPARSRFGFERGALGVRLASGYRLALKARRRGVYLYLRGQF